jgi:DNA-binding response OmpR family regulator
MATRVLIVDDDERLTTLLTEYFDQFGLSVRAAATAEDGLRALKADPPDVLVLDVMLPDMDGFTVCRKIRDASSVPILMLTARGDVTDRVVGLELGADDYVPKPFEPRELVARIQAVLRRGARGDEAGAPTRIGALEVNWAAHGARLGGQALPLTSAEFELLALFLRNRNRVLSRDRIMDQTRGIDWAAYDRSIDVLVSRLRQKLGDDPRQPAFIQTVRGTGYRFIGGHDE